MNNILLTVLISIATCLIGLIVSDIYVHIKKTSKKVIDIHNKEQEDKVKALIQETMKGSLTNITSEIDDIKHDVSAIYKNDIPTLRLASQASLRDQLTNMFIRCQAQGFRTMRDTENAEHMFTSYKNLGGNSYILELMDEFRGLPVGTVEKITKEHKDIKIQ